MIIYFDTETTGLAPGRIVQLSYVLEDESAVRAKNFFFAVEHVDPAVVAIHGFSAEKLAVLSGGKTFSTECEEIYDDFSSADLIVAHNVGFDIKFLEAEFGYMDRMFRYKAEFDTMRYFTPIMKMTRSNHPGYKFPRLSELTEFLDIYPYDITRASGRLFGETSVAGHDARYDTASLKLIFDEGVKRYPDLKAVYENAVSTKNREDSL